MEREDRELEDLQLLGLTLYQAKVYLALALSGNSMTAKQLSIASGLAPCDIYKVIPQLREAGLLTALVTAPKEFHATSPEVALKILSKQMKAEIEGRMKKARAFLAEFHASSHSVDRSAQVEGAEMVLFPPGYSAIRYNFMKLRSTERELNAVQTNAHFLSFIDINSHEAKRLLKKGIIMRFVVESSQAIENPSDDLTGLMQDTNFKVNSAKNKIQACVLLYDESDAFISASLGTPHVPSYWSNNPCIISVVKNYFRTFWNNSYKLGTSKSQTARNNFDNHKIPTHSEKRMLIC